MEITFEYWYLFPISTIIATIAMSTGVGGAVFFSPLFMLALQLDAKIAIGTALINELFGFSSGVIAYFKSKLIDFKLAGNLLIFSIPTAILGTYYADLIPGIVLKSIFATGLVFIGYQIYTSWRKEIREKLEKENKEEFEDSFESKLTDSSGNVYKYTVCNKGMGRVFAGVGGAFLGMISVGLAELQEYHLVAKCKVPTPVAVGTSVFVVVITVLFASVGHIYEFVKEGGDVINQVINLVIFSVPGVILGGQIGPRLQKILPEDKLKIGIAFLFMFIGVFMLYTIIR